jgi:hypothetical protein
MMLWKVSVTGGVDGQGRRDDLEAVGEAPMLAAVTPGGKLVA